MSGAEPGRLTVFVHVGLPKTGTTFLQDLMREHRAALAREGLHYPLRKVPDHFLAALDARGDHVFAGGERDDAKGAWQRLVRQVAACTDRALISHEILATADQTAARKARALLDAHDVHVVVTARDPARQLVADWQESVKHGRKQTFTTYVRRAGLSGAPKPGGVDHAAFRAQHLIDVLDAWAGDLAADHVHVVTVPPAGSDPGLLWRRFAGLLGVEEPDRFAAGQAVRHNARLGVADIELLRRVGRALDHRIVSDEFGAVAKNLYAQSVLPKVSRTAPPVLPAQLLPRATQLAESWMEQVSARGYDVRGDLADLRPVAVDGPAPQDWDAGDVINTAAAATAELLLEIAGLRRTVASLKGVGADEPGQPTRSADSTESPSLSDRVARKARNAQRRLRSR